MSRMLQVRNLPDDVHERLKQRATEERMSLSDFVARELTKLVEYRSNAEIIAEARKRFARPGGVSSAELIRAERDERERVLMERIERRLPVPPSGTHDDDEPVTS